MEEKLDDLGSVYHGSVDFNHFHCTFDHGNELTLTAAQIRKEFHLACHMAFCQTRSLPPEIEYEYYI